MSDLSSCSHDSRTPVAVNISSGSDPPRDPPIESERDVSKIVAAHGRHEGIRSPDAHIWISPVRFLPPEILVDVFIHATSLEHRTSLLDINASPWTLGRVCRQWRSVAISAPQLWNDVVIDFDSPPRIPNASLRLLLKTILDRSRKYPLNVMFISTMPSISSLDVELLNLVAGQSFRWRALDIQPCLVKHLSPVLCLTGLRRLTISDDEDYVDTGAIFQMAPNLRVVEGFCSLKLGPSLLPFSQLTHLSGQFSSALETYNVLRAAIHLVELRLAYDIDLNRNPSAAPSPSSPCISLPSLRRLSLLVGKSATFLDYLILPSLKTLEFANSGGAPFATTLLPQLQARSGFPLENLTIEHPVYESPEHLIDFLRSLPKLQQLEITGMRPSTIFQTSRVFFQAAMFDSKSQRLLPCLKRLYISTDDIIDHDLIMEFQDSRYIGSRREHNEETSCAKLEYLEVHGYAWWFREFDPQPVGFQWFGDGSFAF